MLAAPSGPPAPATSVNEAAAAGSGPPRLSGRLTAALVVSVAFIAFLVLDQQHWWRAKPDYSFGWMVPLFVAYIVHLRWPDLRAAIAAPAPAALSRRARLVLDAWAWLALIAGCACFLLGALIRAGVGASQPASLVLALGFAAVLPAIVYLTTPPGTVMPAGARGCDAQVRAASLFLFPACVWLLSAPLVSAVESALSVFLLRQVVAVVFSVFTLLGYPLVQEGNVLVLPLGKVGVAEACSGIRSLTGCLFAGTFLAAVTLPRLWQKAVLVACALALAFATNLARSLFLTAWAYAHGSGAIEGRLHDGTGYAVLGLTVLGLLALLPLFRQQFWIRLLGGARAADTPDQT